MATYGAEKGVGSDPHVRPRKAGFRRKEASSLNALRAIVFFLEAQSNRRGPVRAYDASGLILRFLQDAGLTRHAMDCRDLYRACFPRCRCDLSPGDLVFRHNGRDIFHVGVYLGDWFGV